MFADDLSYSFSIITIPGATSFPEVFDINDRGDIVGGYYDGSPQEHGFIDRRGHIVTIDVPGADGTEAHGINNRGDVVGTYTVDSAEGPPTAHGFVYHRGHVTTLDLPGAANTQLFGINDRGQIVGFGSGGEMASEGFLFDHGRFTSITVPDSSAFNTIPHGINNRGQIVGDYGMHGFLYEDGEFTLINPPGAFFTNLWGINDLGQASGYAETARGGVLEGVLYDHGQFTTIDFPTPHAPPQTFLRGNNDRGDIVGDSHTPAAFAAFVATLDGHCGGGIPRHEG